MRRLSAKNQQTINRAMKKGILVEEFINDYGIRFTLKLLKHLIKPEKKGPQTTYLICPKEQMFSELGSEKQSEYLEDLKNAGFRTKAGYKEFVDEETGEVVSAPRFKIYYFCHKINK